MARQHLLTNQLIHDARSARRRNVHYVFAGLGSVLSKQDRYCQGVVHNVVGSYALFHRSRHPLHHHVARNAAWCNGAHDLHVCRTYHQSIRHAAHNGRCVQLNLSNVWRKLDHDYSRDRRNAIRSCVD